MNAFMEKKLGGWIYVFFFSENGNLNMCTGKKKNARNFVSKINNNNNMSLGKFL